MLKKVFNWSEVLSGMTVTKIHTLAIYNLLTIFYTVKYIFLKSKTKKVGKLLDD